MTPNPHHARLSFVALDALADGQVAAAVDRAIGVALSDLDKFGSDGKVREVVLSVKIKPVGARGRVKVTVNCTAELPGEKPKPTIGVLIKEASSAAVLFNTRSAANPDQRTLFEAAEDAAVPD